MGIICSVFDKLNRPLIEQSCIRSKWLEDSSSATCLMMLQSRVLHFFGVVCEDGGYCVTREEFISFLQSVRKRPHER